VETRRVDAQTRRRVRVTLGWIAADLVALAVIGHGYTRDGDVWWLLPLAMVAGDLGAEVFRLRRALGVIR
jgi:fatty acid desaturase